jgi:hypothetical protein
MRFPYHKWIEYLLLTKHSDNEVQVICRDIGLAYPGVVYLNEVRQAFIDGASSPFQKYLKADDVVITKMHRKDIKKAWLDGLTDLHNLLEDVEVALTCFMDPRKRKHLDIYSMCADVDLEKLVESFNIKFDMDIDDSIIQEYMTYFFDVESMNEADWKRFIKTLDAKDRRDYELAPGRKSPYIQWRLGDSVHISPDDVAREVMCDFTMLYKDEVIHKNDGWEEKICKFADMSLKASDRVSKNETTGAGRTKQLLMLFTEKEEPLASYDELNQGDEESDPTSSDNS